MYEWNEEEKKIDFSHNPFSMPNLAAEDFLALNPNDADTILALKAIQYDVVCNGIELSSGAIRNHRPDVMKKAFAIAGYGEEVLEQKFGGMLRALSLGAPPHGGIAPGIDRMVMLLAGEENLREVVLFPMNQRAEDLLMGAPSEVSAEAAARAAYPAESAAEKLSRPTFSREVHGSSSARAHRVAIPPLDKPSRRRIPVRSEAKPMLRRAFRLEKSHDFPYARKLYLAGGGKDDDFEPLGLSRSPRLPQSYRRRLPPRRTLWAALCWAAPRARSSAARRLDARAARSSAG